MAELEVKYKSIVIPCVGCSIAVLQRPQRYCSLYLLVHSFFFHKGLNFKFAWVLGGLEVCCQQCVPCDSNQILAGVDCQVVVASSVLAFRIASVNSRRFPYSLQDQLFVS